MPANILNLESYQILNVDETQHGYHIEAEVSTPPSICIHCSSTAIVGFGRRKELILDAPMHAKRTGININRRRYRCNSCGKTFYESIPEKDDKRQATKRLVAYIERQSLSRTFTSIAEEVGMDEKSIRNIFRDYVSHLEQTVRFEIPKWMGIDEIHIINKPRCVISNIQHRTVVDILHNRNKATVTKYLKAFNGKDDVQYVAMDMWRPYRDAVREVMPDAKIVIDKFHVVRMANVAMESIRKSLRASLEPKDRRGLMHDRFVLLKRRDTLNMEEALKLSGWVNSYPELGVAYNLKETFFEIWNADDREQAESLYGLWKGNIPPQFAGVFEPITRAMENWHEEIFSYFDHPVTNAYTESLNSLIRVMNRLGRGYSFEALRARILFTEGIQKKERATTSYRTQKRSNESTSIWQRVTAAPYEEQHDSSSHKNYGVDISTLVRLIEAGAF